MRQFQDIILPSGVVAVLATVLIGAAPRAALAQSSPVNEVKSGIDNFGNIKTVECYCTDRMRTRFELGQRICMEVDGRSFTAECQISVNVPMWREVGEGCETSALPLMSEPDKSMN
jgi:hypothetical protein